jgi:hypothetical protein
MATAATAMPFVREGMAPELAVELARQINDGENATMLMGLGCPAPLATELASQIDLEGSPPDGANARLAGLGVPYNLANAIVASIAAAFAA